MSSRAGDWSAQAQRDLDHAVDAGKLGRHEWVCFAAQQSAEKAVKALHLSLGQDAWGRVISTLLRELPQASPEDLVERAHVLDGYYIPTRYAKGTPRERPSNISDGYRVSRLLPMPVRSLNSSVLRWPRLAEVDSAVRELAQRLAHGHPEMLRMGYFGSYARGDWGVGSDVDLIVIVSRSALPFMERTRAFDVSRLPVPADLLVYTAAEWEDLLAEPSAFAARANAECRWVFERTSSAHA